MGYAVFAFLIIFVLLASGLLLLFYREALAQRLSGILKPQLAAAGEVAFLDRIGMKRTVDSVGAFAGSIGRSAPTRGGDTSAVRQRLVLAGFRREDHLNKFYGFKVVLPVLLCVIAFVTGLYRWNAAVSFAMAIGLGYIVPDFWIRHLTSRRQNAMREGLPDLLDLLVVCLEAGLSIDQAALRSSEEMLAGHPIVAEEIGLVMLEARAGQARIDAWKRLGERTNDPSVHMLISILVQADQFGTGISRTLRTHADTMRTRRKQQVEEMAAKTTVKLVFPLVLCIFPAFFLVVLGPAVILTIEAFGN